MASDKNLKADSQGISTATGKMYAKNKRQLGSEMEVLAIKELTQMGYEILEHSYRCRLGETDIVARDGAYLVFIEVKYRRTASYGTPFEAVDYRKQQKIRMVAQYYLMEHHLSENTPVRFDAVGILGTNITVIKNAF